MDVIIHANMPSLKKQAVHVKPSCFYESILQCLGYSQAHMPVADLLRQVHGLSGTWLVASPITWQLTQQGAIIDGRRGTLQFSTVDATAYFQRFTEFAQPFGISTYFHDPYTWLIEVSHCPLNAALSLTQVYQQPLLSALKAIDLDGTAFWQKFLTECQMFFNSCRLPCEVATSAVNGVWVWGSGTFQSSHKPVLYEHSLQSLAAVLTKRHALYIPEHAAEKNALLILEQLSAVGYETISYALRRRKINWFWEDGCHQTRALPWFKWLRFGS